MLLEFQQIATFDGHNIEMVPELDNRISIYDLEDVVGRRTASDNMDIPIELKRSNQLFSSQALISYGVRSFPHLGPYAFWREKYSDNTRIVVPLYNEDKGNLPTLTLSVDNGHVNYSITPPSSSNYYCYKIHFTKGWNRRDIVTYELEGSIELEEGEYQVTCRGYSKDGYNSALTADQFITV
jgi:hypothetical protein